MRVFVLASLLFPVFVGQNLLAQETGKEKLTVVARLKAKAGMEEKVRQELAKLVAPTRREKGCINYDLHQGLKDKTVFIFYENWDSEADLQKHLKSPHILHWIDISKELLAEPIEIAFLRKVN